VHDGHILYGDIAGTACNSILSFRKTSNDKLDFRLVQLGMSEIGGRMLQSDNFTNPVSRKVSIMNPATDSNSTTYGTDDGGTRYVLPDGAEAFFRNFIYGTLFAMAALLAAVVIFQFVGGNYREHCYHFYHFLCCHQWTSRISRSIPRRQRRANEQHIVDDRGRIIQTEGDEGNHNDDDDFESDGYSISLTGKFHDGSGRWNRTQRNLTDQQI
jgi:hypothetical protein